MLSWPLSNSERVLQLLYLIDLGRNGYQRNVNDLCRTSFDSSFFRAFRLWRSDRDGQILRL